MESGACVVKYDVRFKNSTGNHLYNFTRYNIGEVKICNLTEFAKIFEVQMTVRLENSFRNMTAKVSKPVIAPDSKTSGMTTYI